MVGGPEADLLLGAQLLDLLWEHVCDLEVDLWDHCVHIGRALALVRFQHWQAHLDADVSLDDKIPCAQNLLTWPPRHSKKSAPGHPNTH